MSDERRTKPKRIQVSGIGDNWTTWVVLCDGKPLEVEGVSLGVEVDKINTVTLTLSALDVHLTIQTPAEYLLGEERRAEEAADELAAFDGSASHWGQTTRPDDDSLATLKSSLEMWG